GPVPDRRLPRGSGPGDEPRGPGSPDAQEHSACRDPHSEGRPQQDKAGDGSGDGEEGDQGSAGQEDQHGPQARPGQVGWSPAPIRIPSRTITTPLSGCSSATTISAARMRSRTCGSSVN